MIDLTCPNCGRVGSVPKEKEHSRLVCRKCHSVFHRTSQGKTHLGEPPVSQAATAPRGVHSTATGRDDDAGYSFFSIGEMSRLRLGLVGVFLLLGLVAGSWMMLSEKPESLDIRARKAANALVASDLKTLQTFAKVGSEEDITHWRDSITPQIEEMKTASLTSRVVATVLVTQEDPITGFGQVSLFLSPAGVQARRQTGGDAPAPQKTTEFVISWYLDPSGRWMLDGQSTLQRVVASR